VFNFLGRYCGKPLVSSSKDEDLIEIKKDESAADDLTTHAVAALLGAALAIALASGVFGALACFWRTQQKNQKYMLRFMQTDSFSLLDKEMVLNI